MPDIAVSGVREHGPMTEERVEVLDESGAVVGVADRAEVWSRNLWHRTAFVVVRSTGGAVLAHQRALTKRMGPGKWDLGFGGACDVGEDWHDAAARELYEEAGIRTPLRELGTYRWDGDGSREVGRLYETVSDGPFTYPADEVATAQFVAIEDLDRFVEEHVFLEAALNMVLPYVR
jgi:8-oxo-dGTP pyrophosphatase MutT (NUDIX family)